MFKTFLVSKLKFLAIFSAFLWILRPAVSYGADYSSVDPASKDAYTTNVQEIAGLKNGKIKVVYTDNSIAKFAIFDTSTDNKTKVAQQKKSGWLLVLSPTGKKLKMVNPYTGAVVSTLTLSENKSYKNTSLQQYNLRSDQDSAVEAIITAKKGDAVLLSVVKVKLNDKKLVKKSSVQYLNSAIDVSKTKFAKKSITLQDADENAVAKYTVSTKYDVAPAEADYSVAGKWAIAITWDDNSEELRLVECVPNDDTTDPNDGILMENDEEIGTCTAQNSTATFYIGNITFTGDFASENEINGNTARSDEVNTGVATARQNTVADYDVRGVWYQFWEGNEANGNSQLELVGEENAGTVIINGEVLGTYTFENGVLDYEVGTAPANATVHASFFDADTLSGTWWNAVDGTNAYKAYRLQ